MTKLYLYFALCCLLDVCVGQIVQDGQCNNNIIFQPNFNLESFPGTWHELLRTDNPNQRGECSSFIITDNNNNGTLDVQYRKVNSNFVQYINGTLTPQLNAISNTSREFTLDIPFFETPIDFIITFNDDQLTTVSVAYSCQNIDTQRRSIQLWILGRNNAQLSFAMEHVLNMHLSETFGVQLSNLTTVNQSELSCFVLPVIPPGEAIIIPGTCNNDIPVQQAFNPLLFGGTWHQIASYFTESSSGGCVRAEYYLDGGVVDVLNTQVIDQTLQTITGNATIISNDGSARLRVLLDVAGATLEQELWILATDYQNYAVSYSCETLPNNQRRLYSWILSRQRTLNQTAQIEVNNLIDSILELNNIYYLPTDQSLQGCFFLPEPNGRPVVFRGQCEMNNASAMTNFTAEEYMGLWHTIELYPSFFQEGSCSNARYSLNGRVDVVNTQVINTTLETFTGFAVPASDDGTAKFLVTFPVMGNTQTDYWVLDTNYTSYALVYSCANIDEEYMRVNSWKLSRSRTLTAEDRLAIDRVISTTNVLNQQYYEAENQTEEDCFFIPTPEEGVPVVFPGRCDPNLGMENFNLTLFAGTWYEIQAYPKIEQTGQCISHEYSDISVSELSFVSSSVTDNFLLQSQGRLISTNGTGRLTINITSGPEPIEIPFWIIDTDYDNYALAYACVDQPGDLRAVWSWKLSRTRELSVTSETAINIAIADIDVLDSKYFWDIDHSNETCYVLPVIPPGEPIILPGQCDPNIMRVQSFNPISFGGTWHQISSYFSESSPGSCVRAEYALNGGVVDVLNSQVINQTLLTITGNASIISNDGSAHLGVTLNVPSNQVVQQELWILATDYQNYAVSYSCENLPNNQRRIFSWILSRQRTLNATAQIEVNNVIGSLLELNNAYFLSTDQSSEGCFYFPEVNPDAPVRFRGKCDESIPAVPNFNPVQYMGLWHDIRSYPEDFQTGTCQNANYELVGSVVDVLNTQVINQTLDTMTGIAVIASDDGSARLNVTFNVGGIDVTTNYWVLATNYSSYALVYSCRQVDEDYYQVSSWQLSRTRELTNESITEINAVIDTIPVLDERYYLNRLQSPEDCFYFPEPEPNTPVIFRGQCDDNIAAISNFNETQFAGLWHEIEKYPYGPNDICIDHRFELGSSSIFNHNSFHVLNETLLLVNNSTVNLTSTDGTGRLTIDIVVNGTVQTIPFWILDTDYNNYALAYGCRNLENDYRQIYSWKLSRTRQLTNQSATAIDASMSNIDVLDNRYFDTIQQTDEDCFYLPEIGPNDPVTFIGQCNPNIPVVTDFNATAYLGTWRLIETYFADFQMGTCNTAHYSEGNNSVLVVNTQVINQRLDKMIGSAVPAGTDGSGKLLVTFPTSPTPSDYWILGTDYTSYALVYSCLNIGNDRRRVWSWKLSRTTSLTPNATTAINNIVDSIDVLNERFYQTVNNSDVGCFFYPVPDPNSPVIFPGQCDTTITAMAEFDAERYLNIWYDIESYPAPFQTGTCSRANYTLNDDGSVRVENTQVVNQLLETWIGTAMIASDDGTAKLNVTFNVNGVNVTTNLLVLDTDYDSYALAYSCENISPDWRVVFSWKLSRFTTLTANATQAINNIIDSIQVLRQKYFVPRGHTEEDCFYYPDNNGGDVILNGQCLNHSAVPAVTDFNANLFAGRWFEVSRFPSDVQQGQCFTSKYSLNGTNALILERSFVFNEIQFNSTTEATVSADGRGVISANINGVPFTDVYILGIDYQDFALTYSCRNLDENRKQIFSWILSRSPDGISAAAQNITSELISSNIDLWEGYYEPTGQDDDACFFYPPLDQLPGVVELRGPCPTNIRGVPNFKAEDYLGRWFETSRYFVQDQVGQCNRAEYSVDNATQRVAVFNSEVLNQTLLTQLGYAIVASTDGTGELSVDFNVNGVQFTANYYILATDYTSYSLVYSCTNITGGWRRVSSWQLSRNRTLSSDAVEAMAPVINATQGLLDKYYQPTSQSDDDCFYIPYNYTDRTPRFRGQCENVTGVANFNVSSYLGWWHEIERYPVDDLEVGQCRSSEYNQGGDAYLVVDKWVRDIEGTNQGFVRAGTVTATPEGKLVRTMSNGKTQDIWVLATDYETYSLLYACEQDENDEYRQVWSAKHSKSRSLPEDAQEIMSPIIANNSVLFPQFYQNVDQSDDTCFHYPTIAEGEAVIIPGQCNLTIPVMSDLNINDFSGTWFEMARYDAVNGSSCSGYIFTVDQNSGTIQVLNFEVRDGELITTEGEATVTQGSGLIQVTMPTAEGVNTTTSWYILRTDYTGYAVAYNCVNVNNYRRQIRAWTLSRDRPLTTASSQAIQTLIGERQELNEQYFRTIVQSEDCPDPSSALFVKSSLIVLLICAMFQWLL
ncbi:unnamed protein product [Arctia plantaginis]|uniref:Lipocalin/cytosolic fatty-acid binding domain-containing protein n=1 Tax=Arctia plantaginis TaxID=874455 RepID=A0A8S1ASF1_ARCPL|nr:unnamed protein product [Arctia plantaginis]